MTNEEIAQWLNDNPKEANELVNKYAKRFINVFHNINKKEQISSMVLIRSIQTALIVETLSFLIQDAADNGKTVNDIEEKIKLHMHSYNEMLMSQFEVAANQLIQQMAEANKH